ncbi:hypothetical protein [Hyphomicrobium sp.]|uniref:hypothetical protein n=1 Tax=Hyphomicrobium sp. TaxID=82 RepID=UPI0025C04C01|nr:hypothetical protein [Hyphomicrobium sp.]MCC7251540.1 hypothetical protein [Hyphomicrobium sp.]
MRRGVGLRAGIGACVVLAGGAALSTGPAAAGPAIGQFEMKTLDSEPGELEFQSQNAVMFGNPRRKSVTDVGGDLEADDNSLARARAALELEFGITRYLKGRIGIEYERERREDFRTIGEAQGYEDLKLDEYAAELIGVIVPRHGDGIGVGIVVEFEVPAESGGAKTLIAGPIFEWASGPWSATVIPTLVQFFGGERNEAGQQDEKIDFAYATQLKYRWSEHFDFALEAYGTVERIGGRGGKSEESALFGDFDQHRLGPIVYWNFTPEFARKADGKDDDEEMVSLGFGALFGLNDDTPDTTLKLSMEVFF